MAIGYKAAIDWLVRNDDCNWVWDELRGDEKSPSPSIAAALLADVYGKDEVKVWRDLQRAFNAAFPKKAF